MNIIERFILIPLFAVIGIYIVSVFIDAALGLKNETFRNIFTGIGGISFLAYYYKKELEK